jgi:uncharacterized protein (TIGR03435 family)
MKMITVLFSVAIVLQAGPVLPSFDVASVKLNRNPPTGPRVMSLRLSLSHGTLTFVGYSLRNLLLQAYDINAPQIVGCPNWCDSDAFDVIGKADDPDAAPEQVRLMLQSLLADRFKLAVHREQRELPGYSLAVSKSGSKLKPAKDEEVIGVSTIGYARTFTKMPINGLVNFLAGIARQPVVDNTGLKGPYDFILDLTPSEDPLRGVISPAADPANGFGRVAAAVEDQLGLKLEPHKISVENFIIDHVDHPSEN